MILYEIHSNVAGSDQNLVEYPALMDLADTLKARSIEVRFVRQFHQETDEINLAQGQFGQGVRVRGTALKTYRPEAHLRGCLSWLKAMLGRPTRAMHLELSQVRSTNGAPLVMESLLPRDQRVFLTGMEPEPFRRLCIAPDLRLEAFPAALADHPELVQEYVARRQRAAGFLNQIKQVAELGVLAPEQGGPLEQMVKARDLAAVGRLSDAQTLNIALISDFVERYQTLLDQFFDQLKAAEAGSDLPGLFELLVQGLELNQLRRQLEPFVLENARGRLGDKRALINAVRIGLANREESLRDEFAARFRAMVLKRRMARDPELYGMGMLLPTPDPDEIAVLSPLRRILAEVQSARAALPGEQTLPQNPVPAEVKRRFFELVISLTFEAQFSSRLDESRLPRRALKARELLPLLRLRSYDISGLQRLNPKVPISGVAANLAQRIPIAFADLDVALERFGTALTPLGRMADALVKTLSVRVEEESRIRRARAVRHYLTRAYPLLGLTNYVLGRASLSTLEWSALLAGGRALGLPLVTSRDQIRNAKALAQIREGHRGFLEGYVLLLNRDEVELLPPRSDPITLATAFRHLFETQVIRLVRRLIYQRLQVLAGQYGEGLMELFYKRVTDNGALQLSRNQLATILVRHRVFEKARLAEFGYRPDALINGDDDANPWLLPVETGPFEEAGEHPFAPQRIAAVWREALEAFRSLIAGYGPAQGGATSQEESRDLRRTLAGLCAEEIYDLRDARAREPLGRSGAALQLWKAVQEAIAKNFKTIVGEAEEGGESYQLVLPGRLAHLALLKPEHSFKMGERTVKFELVPERATAPEELDASSRPVVEALSQAVGPGGSPLLREALETLAAHGEKWEALRHLSMLPMTDQMLRETLLRLVRPAPPSPRDVAGYPESAVLYASVSSADQAKFHRMAPPSARLDQYATLSELAGWLGRFPRLQEEMEGYRGLIADALAALSRLNLSVWDAPYLNKYRQELAALDELLSIRPEHLDRDHLRQIETLSREIGAMVRDIHNQEQAVRPRDRWLGRVATRFRRVQPNFQLTFVDLLCEGSAGGPPRAEGAEPAPARDKEYQTFSERVRNVIDYRERLADKEVFVLSPTNTQRNLTLGLLERLFALKGLYTPILVDISGCESFVDALQSRIPPHRLFNLNDL